MKKTTKPAPVIEGKRLLTLEEAAWVLSLSTPTLRRMAANKEVPVIQRVEGSRVLFDVRDLERWIEANRG
jgi:excisionase family DNA binding protein